MTTIQNTIKSKRRVEGKKDAKPKEPGDYQSVVLAAIGILGTKVTVDDILMNLLDRTKEAPDVAQTYVTIGTLLERQWIEKNGQRLNAESGRPASQFKLTPEGRAAIKRKRESLRKLSALLEMDESVASVVTENPKGLGDARQRTTEKTRTRPE